MTKLAQVFQVSVEALRSQNLTQQLAPAVQGGTGKVSEGGAPRGEGLSQPAKYPLVVSVELDGTGAGRGPADGYQWGSSRNGLMLPDKPDIRPSV